MLETEMNAIAKIENRQLSTLFASIAISLVISVPTSAQDTPPKTGAEFERELQNAVGVTWEGEIGLRDATEKHSAHHGVCFLLDRRIDPGRKVLAAKNTRLETAIRALAEQLRIGVCFFDSVAYLGPTATTSKLTTVAAVLNDQLRDLPDLVKRRLIRTANMKWDNLAEPRELLQQLGQDAGISIAGADRFEHDLWAANHLPALGFVERATLILAGFDLAFEFDDNGKSVRLVSFPKGVTLTRSYSIPGDIGRVMRILKGRFPDVEMGPEGDKLVVVASLDIHQAIRDQLAGKPPKPKAPAVKTEKVYTLNVENKEVGAVVLYLAKQFELDPKFDAAAQGKLKDLTSFSVKDANVNELFKAVLDPVGLSFRINGKQLDVFGP